MKPILFNTEQARNILDGRKTNTRRPLRHQPAPNWDVCERIGNTWCFYDSRDPDAHGYLKENPYQVGDILYVRETWAIEECQSCLSGLNYSVVYCQCRYVYKADGEKSIKWHPTIHMPREAARIFLKVTDVRVERLQDITPDDMDKEGLPFCMSIAPYDGFEEMWNAIYAKRGYSWNSNPWVWVYEFERMKGEQG